MPEQEQPIESKIKQTANGIAAAIDEALNPDGKKEWGFALLMFRLGDNREGDRMNYISNARPRLVNMETWKPDIAKIPESHCLECGYLLNASATADGTQQLPSPGDLMVCMKCGAVMLHAGDLSPRGMTDQEMDDLIADTETMNEIAKVVKRIYLIRQIQ
jgi:hypothetical protein